MRLSADDAGWRTTRLAVYRAVSDAAAKGVMFAVTIGAARRLSRDDFGLFALASTLGWLAAVAADFGIHMHLARTVALAPARAASAFATWLPVRALTGLAAIVLSVVLLGVIGAEHGAALPLALFALAYAVSGFTDCIYHLFRGLDRTDLESSLTLAQRGALAILAAAALTWRPGLATLALALLVPSLLTCTIALALARRLDGSAALPASRADVRRELLRSVVPIGAGILLSAIYFRIDVVLLEQWRGPGEAGAYNAVFRIVEALRLAPAALLAVAFPALCRATDARLLARLSWGLTSVAAIASVALWSLAGIVVPALYGQAYAEAVAPFRTLLLAFPLMTLNYTLSSQLLGWHGHRAWVAGCAAALTVNLLLNTRWIPLYGMGGAAWATLWTEVALTLACVVGLARLAPVQAQMIGEPAVEAR